MIKSEYFVVKIILLSTLIFMQGLQDVCAQEIKGKEVGITYTSADDIWSKTKDGSSFSEFWNYQIYFDNGMSLYIIFSVSDISPFSSSVSGLRVSMYNLDGTNFEINREYPLEHLVQEQNEHKFNINPRQDNIWFKGSLPSHHEIYINTAKDGNRFKIHLTFDEILPGIKVGDGRYTIDGKEVGIITQIPYARVSGYAGINDNVKEVRGTAYMDQTFHFENTGRNLHSGFRFVHHKSSEEWELTYYIQPKSLDNSEIIGYHLTKSNRSVKANRIGVQAGVNQYLTDQRRFPSEFSLTREGAPPLSFLLGHEIDRRSIFSDLNWVARNVARRLVGGEIFDHRGTGRIKTGDDEPASGYYNYFIAR